MAISRMARASPARLLMASSSLSKAAWGVEVCFDDPSMSQGAPGPVGRGPVGRGPVGCDAVRAGDTTLGSQEGRPQRVGDVQHIGKLS